jgi:hypothetical protein
VTFEIPRFILRSQVLSATVSIMSDKYLQRYTDLPKLIHLLRTKTITLGDPKYWDDKNDSYFLAQYLDKKKLKTVLALCFAQGNETYHHWRIFAGHSSGVCIRFDRDALLKELTKAKLLSREVEYFTLKQMRGEKKTLNIKDLPFRKRYAYGDENEFRVIFASKAQEQDFFDVPINLNCINRITLSPWMTNRLKDAVKKTIRSIHGCEKIKVYRSTLIENQEWKKCAESAF